MAVFGLVAPMTLAGYPPVALAASTTEGITFRVRGTVNAVVDFSSDVVGYPGLGESFVLDYAFDPTTPAGYQTDIYAIYPAVTSMTLTFENGYEVTSTASSGSAGTISIAGSSNPQLRSYRAQFEGLSESRSIGSDLTEVFMEMGNSAVAPTGTALSPEPPNPTHFGYSYLAVNWRDPNACDDGDPRSCFRNSTIQASIDSIEIVGQGPIDSDGDGIADGIAMRDEFGQPIAGAFDDTSGTTGQILTGTGILVEDAPDPDGVRITTTAPATLRVCGLFTMSVAAGSDIVITCGSVSVRVTSGSTTIDLGSDGNVRVPQGGAVTVDRVADGTYSALNNGTTPVEVTRGGTTVVMVPGATAFSRPQSKDDCKNGGWRNFGIYRNQGQCVSSVASAKK